MAQTGTQHWILLRKIPHLQKIGKTSVSKYTSIQLTNIANNLPIKKFTCIEIQFHMVRDILLTSKIGSFVLTNIFLVYTRSSL